jgi:hypothetical protein
MAHELASVYEALAGFGAVVGLDAEREDARRARRAVDAAELLLRQLVVRRTREARVVDPAHQWMLAEELRHAQCVAAMRLHAQVQRLDALQDQPGVER